ncbi:MAG: helix-hairpin-helix domain-containing protein [Lachnospiraceae bacterium]|nr:helix-hairpin-helix domain-containing protein [Lachnospiraceae bacterium]
MHKGLRKEAYLKKSITCILIIILSVVFALSTGCQNEEAVIELEQERSETDPIQVLSEEEAADAVSTVTVYVCGAVTHPGVYELEDGSRVVDAIYASGGMSTEADRDYINQAMLLKDGDKVYIPTCEETAQAGDSGINSGNLSGMQDEPDKVNINTADAKELMTLPGIGEAKAALIIEYRENNGGFDSIEDIMKISGIKEGMFNKIKDRIRI